MKMCGRLLVLSLFLFGLGVGCSKKNADPIMGSLSGKVTVKNEALTGGKLLFKFKDGKEAATLDVNADGSYEGTLPVGEMLVAVETESVKKALDDMQGKGGT